MNGLLSVARFYVFIIRIILGAAFAVLLSRFFYPDWKIMHVAGLGAFLVVVAYILEYWKKKKP
jgi:uncharacterized membrane protein YoaK (UPF0700 family)